MIETQEIRYFMALVQHGHFGRAAAACGVTQPALTRGIRKLEEKLGGLLFDRRPGQAELTMLGRTVLPNLEAAVREMDGALDAAHALHGTRLSTLRLGVMCTIGPSLLLPLVTNFARQEKTIELAVREAPAGAVLDMLIAGEIDIGIASWPEYPPGVEVRRCFEERYAVAVPATHPLAARSSIRLAELDGNPYLRRLNCEFDEHFAAQVGPWSINLVIRFSSEREDWIQSMVAGGDGIAIVPEYLDVGSGIVVKPLVDPVVVRTVSLVTLETVPRTAAADAFLEKAAVHAWSKGGELVQT